MCYQYRSYLTNFLQPILRKRQKEKEKIEAGDPTGCPLTVDLDKGTLNFYYGYNALQRNVFPKTFIRTGSQLVSRHSTLLSRARSITLIGCIPRKKKHRQDLTSSVQNLQDQFTADENEPDLELLYSISVDNSQAKITNLIQVSACILSNSKEIYFSHIKWLLDMMSSKRCELKYLDTDSIILSGSSPNLRDMVETRKLVQFDREVDYHIFREGSGLEAPGKLKYEFIGDRGYVYAVKCYYIEKDQDDGEAPVTIKRFKGCSRDVQKFLDARFYNLQSSTGLSEAGGFANRRKLAGTMGYQMSLTLESKALTHPISFKRIWHVRMKGSLLYSFL